MVRSDTEFIWQSLTAFTLILTTAIGTRGDLCEECTCDTTLTGDKTLVCQPVRKPLRELIAQIPDEFGELEIRRGDFSTLTNDSFASLTNLKKLIIDSCSVAVIEAGAFSKLENLEELELNANDLSTLSGFVFQDLARLKILRLEDNLLSVLEKNIFFGLTNLQTLDITANFVKTISHDAFSSLTDLRKLLLNKNEISDLPPTVFDSNVLLEEINLSKNRLTELHPSTFNDTPLLQEVYLEENKITRLSDQLFAGNTQLAVVSLKDNIFTCDCELSGFRLWMNLTGILMTPDVSGKCGFPENLKGIYLFEVGPSDLVCTTTSTTTTTMPTTTTTEVLYASSFDQTSSRSVGTQGVDRKIDEMSIYIAVGSSLGGVALVAVITVLVFRYGKARKQKPRQVKYILKPNTTEQLTKPKDQAWQNERGVEDADKRALGDRPDRYDLPYKANIPPESNLDEGLEYGYHNHMYTNQPETPKNAYQGSRAPDGLQFYNSLSRSIAGASIGQGGQTPLGTLHRATPLSRTPSAALPSESYAAHRATPDLPYTVNTSRTPAKNGQYSDHTSASLNYTTGHWPTDVYSASAYPGYQSDKDGNGKYSTGSADSGVHSNSPLPRSRTPIDFPDHPYDPHWSSKKTVKNETYV